MNLTKNQIKVIKKIKPTFIAVQNNIVEILGNNGVQIHINNTNLNDGIYDNIEIRNNNFIRIDDLDKDFRLNKTNTNKQYNLNLKELSRANSFTSSDELRIVLSCVVLQKNNQMSVTNSIIGYTTENIRIYQDPDKYMLLHKDFNNILLYCIKDDFTNIDYSDEILKFEFEEMTISSHHVDAKFPLLSKVVPKDLDEKLVLVEHKNILDTILQYKKNFIKETNIKIKNLKVKLDDLESKNYTIHKKCEEEIEDLKSLIFYLKLRQFFHIDEHNVYFNKIKFKHNENITGNHIFNIDGFKLMSNITNGSMKFEGKYMKKFNGSGMLAIMNENIVVMLPHLESDIVDTGYEEIDMIKNKNIKRVF